VRGALIGGAALPALVACGASPEAVDKDTSAGDDSVSSAGGTAEGAGGATPSGVAVLPETDVPVGGGKILSKEKVVVTQPTEGEFKAFTALCTHQGCVVTSVGDGEIVCACHGSHFSIEDGAVISGPAPSPLTVMKVTGQDGQLTVS